MKFRTIVQAKQAALHAAARREFRHHSGQMAAGALDSSSGFQLRKETD
jgi:hypothetical protein